MADHSRDRVEAAAKALTDEGAAPGSSSHSWRCEYPDRYGECGCVYETAGVILAASDEADRVAGVVRVDTRDEALLDRMAHLIDQMPTSGSATIAMALLDEIAAVDRLQAALAAAGAQPPTEEPEVWVDPRADLPPLNADKWWPAQPPLKEDDHG